MKIIVHRQLLPYSDYKVKDTHPNHYKNFDVFLTGEVTLQAIQVYHFKQGQAAKPLT